MLERRSTAWVLFRAVVVILMSGLAGATLVRVAPGFGIDDRFLDPRITSHTRAAVEREHESERNPLAFYGRFLSGVLHGELGRSAISGEPISKLIRERAPSTLRTVTFGLALAWGAAVLFAVAAVLSGRASVTVFTVGINGVLLSIPSAVLATVCLVLSLPPATVISAVAFPRVFPYIYEQLRASLARPHVLMARARGLSRCRVFFFHVVPSALAPVVALSGVSVTLAFGASIPVEALADSPGIGQLAWRAALGRDLPVLVMITLMLTAITVLANALADIAVIQLGETGP
jgi:peptide/nickel transport system permease protein